MPTCMLPHMRNSSVRASRGASDSRIFVTWTCPSTEGTGKHHIVDSYYGELGFILCETTAMQEGVKEMVVHLP